MRKEEREERKRGQGPTEKRVSLFNGVNGALTGPAESHGVATGDHRKPREGNKTDKHQLAQQRAFHAWARLSQSSQASPRIRGSPTELDVNSSYTKIKQSDISQSRRQESH